MKINTSEKPSEIIEKLWREEFPWSKRSREFFPKDGFTHSISHNFRGGSNLIDRLRPSLPINQELRNRISILPLNVGTQAEILPENSHVVAFCLEGGLINMDFENPIILAYNTMMYMPPSYERKHILSSAVQNSTVMLIDMAQEQAGAVLPDGKAVSPDIYNLDWINRLGKEALITDLSTEFGYSAAFQNSPWNNDKLKFLFFEKGQDIKFHQHPKQNFLKVILSGHISYQNQRENLHAGDCAMVRAGTPYHGKAEASSRMLLIDLTQG